MLFFICSLVPFYSLIIRAQQAEAGFIFHVTIPPPTDSKLQILNQRSTIFQRSVHQPIIWQFFAENYENERFLDLQRPRVPIASPTPGSATGSEYVGVHLSVTTQVLAMLFQKAWLLCH